MKTLSIVRNSRWVESANAAALLFAFAFFSVVDSTDAQSKKSSPQFSTKIDKSIAAESKSEVSPSAVTATSNYAFSTATNASLTDMSSGTTLLIGPDLDDTRSALTNIGFDFYFQGARFTQFSVNENGVLRLGAQAQFGNPYHPLAQPAISIITAYGADQRTHAGNGKVHFKVTGAAPNRVTVVEWLNNQSTFPAGGTADLTYQVRLYETTGVIEFVYGSMTMSASGAIDPNSRDPNIGFSSDSVAGTVGSVTAPQSGTPSPTFDGTSATATANLYVAGPITTLNSAAEGSRRIFTFTPPILAGPTNLSFSNILQGAMTLNWTDAPNELGYAIFNSTDNVNFNFVAFTSANVTSQNVSGLATGTNYFWRVYSVSEGALSTDFAQGQARVANNTITSGANGLWSAPGTWIGGVVPTANDDVVIKTFTVTIDINAVALDVTVAVDGTGGALKYEGTTARTLTVGQAVTVGINGTFCTEQNAASSQTGHVLSVGRDLSAVGKLDFSTNPGFAGNNAGAKIIFNGADYLRFTGAGIFNTDIREIQVNKGSSSSSILELNFPNPFSPGNSLSVKGTTTDPSGFVILTNGMLKLTGGFPMTSPVFETAAYTIPATGGIWLDDPNFVVSGTASGTTTNNNGVFKVSQGTYNIGVGAADGMGGAPGALFRIEGGTVNASGRIDPQNNVTYIQSGGTVNVATVGNTRSDFGSFELFSISSIFVMSGGQINLVNHNTAALPVDYRVLSGTTAVGNAAGNPLLTVGTSGAPANTTYRVQGAAPAIQVNDTMTMAVTGQLRMFCNSVLNNGSITSVGANARFDFFGNDPTTYSGSGIFGNLPSPFTGLGVSTVGTGLVTLSAPIVTNRVNLFQGGFINSNFIILVPATAPTATVQIGGVGTSGGSFDVSPNHSEGSALSLLYLSENAPRTTGFEINPTRTVTNLTVDNASNVSLSGGDLTVNGAVTLTSGRLITGANNLITGTSTVSRTTGYVDGNLRRTFNDGSSRTFFVGSASGYTPATISPLSVSFPAVVTVHVTPTQHPAYPPGFPGYVSGLQRYWTINTAPGFIASLSFNYLQSDVRGDENTYHVIKYANGQLLGGLSTDPHDPIANTAGANQVTIDADWLILDDLDADGMTDSFETANGLDPNDSNDANQDADGDGWSNLSEYFAGTNPKNGGSYLRITSTAFDHLGHDVIQFDAVANKQYGLQQKNSITDANWTDTGLVVTPSVTGTAQFSPLLNGATTRYYRVRLIAP